MTMNEDRMISSDTGAIRPEFVAAMRHALSLASHGPAYGVNPQVGCVILDADGAVISEGWHRGSGTAHAEVDALSKLAPGAARGATAVVTLEPCNHTGRTGPCAEALIEAGIARVIYAATDPGTESSGGGERLRAAGVEVTGGVLRDEAEALMHPWLEANKLGRPWITLKWAASLDGRAAAADGSSQWITGTASRQRVHEQREASDAIAVGTATVRADDPSLTARGDGGEFLPHQPIPVVIGLSTIPATARVFSHPQPVILSGSRDLAAIAGDLFARGIRRLFVEGGPTLASAFIAGGLVDEYLIYQAPMLLGGDRLAVREIGVGTIAEARHLQIQSVERLGDDLLIVARPRPHARPAEQQHPIRPELEDN